MGTEKGYKSQFRKSKIKEEVSFDGAYLNTFVTNYLSQNNIQSLVRDLAVSLKTNGFIEEADMMNDLSTRM